MSSHESSVTRTESSALEHTLPSFDEAGALGIFQLKRIWKKSCLSRAQKLDASIAKKEWLGCDGV